jgi:hypothetical protein
MRSCPSKRQRICAGWTRIREAVFFAGRTPTSLERKTGGAHERMCWCFLRESSAEECESSGCHLRKANE